MEIQPTTRGKSKIMPVWRTTVGMTDATWEALGLAQQYLIQRDNLKRIAQHAVVLTALSHLQGVIESIGKERLLQIYDDEALNGQAHKPALHFDSLEWKDIVESLEQIVTAKVPEIKTTSMKLMTAFALIIYAQDIALPAMPGTKVIALDKVGQRRTTPQ